MDTGAEEKREVSGTGALVEQKSVLCTFRPWRMHQCLIVLWQCCYSVVPASAQQQFSQVVRADLVQLPCARSLARDPDRSLIQVMEEGVVAGEAEEVRDHTPSATYLSVLHSSSLAQTSSPKRASYARCWHIS